MQASSNGPSYRNTRTALQGVRADAATAALWIVVIALVAAGVIGTILPVLPSAVFLFAAALLV